jgi:hypothetical protein
MLGAPMPADAKHIGKIKAAVEVPRFSMDEAAVKLHHSIHAHDFEGIADALRHAHAAYEDEQENLPDAG